MREIKYYRSRIRRQEQDSYIEEYSIIAENDEYICINDYRFTTLNRKKDSLNTRLNNVGIIDWGRTISSMSGEFTVYMYTDFKSQKKAEQKINREFQKFLEKAISGYLLHTTNFKIKFTVKEEGVSDE